MNVRLPPAPTSAIRTIKVTDGTLLRILVGEVALWFDFLSFGKLQKVLTKQQIIVISLH